MSCCNYCYSATCYGDCEGVKLSTFGNVSSLAMADRIPVIRGSGGSTSNYNATIEQIVNYISQQADLNKIGLVFVQDASDFPAAVSGVRTLAANTAYFITTEIDLNGDRLVCGANTMLFGSTSEVSILKSTGLLSALITSAYTLPMQNLTITADLAIALDGDGTGALDWLGVNFVDCAVVGTVKDYANFIANNCAFLNSGAITFDGTIGTIGVFSALFNTAAASTSIEVLSTCTVTRRIRIIYSSFITAAGETSIDVDVAATIPTESYILDTVNFSGGGTYLAGVAVSSNKTLFVNCVGIDNTAVNGQLYMNNNATATTISNTTNFFKVAGTTTASADNAKYSHSNNRLTCDAVVVRKYLVMATLSFTSGANNVCQFGFYDSTLGAVRTPSQTKATANAAGRAESVALMCVIEHSSGDYIEVHCKNTSAATNITVDEMNLVITEIN